LQLSDCFTGGKSDNPMKTLLLLLSIFPLFRLSAQIPEFNEDSLALHHVRSITQWTYAMEKTGKKYEAMKMFTNEYDSSGKIVKHIDPDGPHSLGEEKELFTYTPFGKISNYKYLIDTTLILSIDYTYDSLKELITETVNDKDCKDTSKNYRIQHRYGLVLINRNQSLTDTALCRKCDEAMKISIYSGSGLPLSSERKYGRDGKLRSETTYSYTDNGKLKECYMKWNFKCSNCLNDRAIYQYTISGRLLKETHFRDTREVEKEYIYEYDKKGLLTQAKRTYYQNTRILVSDYTYVFFK
jgi:hypothetical protein